MTGRAFGVVFAVATIKAASRRARTVSAFTCPVGASLAMWTLFALFAATLGAKHTLFCLAVHYAHSVPATFAAIRTTGTILVSAFAVCPFVASIAIRTVLTLRHTLRALSAVAFTTITAGITNTARLALGNITVHLTA